MTLKRGRSQMDRVEAKQKRLSKFARHATGNRKEEEFRAAEEVSTKWLIISASGSMFALEKQGFPRSLQVLAEVGAEALN